MDKLNIQACADCDSVGRWVGHSAGRWTCVFEVLLQETFISLT